MTPSPTNMPPGGATPERKPKAPTDAEVANKSALAARQQALRRLLEAGKANAEKLPHDLTGITPLSAQIARPKGGLTGVTPPSSSTTQPKQEEKKASKAGEFLDKAESFVTTDVPAKLKQAGLAGAGAAVLYQVVDNAGEAIGGTRPVLGAIKGIATDITGSWRDIVHVAGQVLSHPVFYIGASLGVAFFWGRKAWRKLKEAWKETAELSYKNEKIVERVDKAAEFTKSASKTAFAALTIYHAPELVSAGAGLFTVSNAAGGWSQLWQVATNFFTTAPLTVYPLFAWMAGVALTHLILPPIKKLIAMGNANKKKADEDKRVKEENAFNNQLMEAAADRNIDVGILKGMIAKGLTPEQAINAYDAEVAIHKAAEQNSLNPDLLKLLMSNGLSLKQAVKFLTERPAEEAEAPEAPEAKEAENKKAEAAPPEPTTILTPPTPDEKAAEKKEEAPPAAPTPAAPTGGSTPPSSGVY